MKAEAQAFDRPISRIAARCADYAVLIKPELTGLSVLTALFGAAMAGGGPVAAGTFLNVLFGTLCVGGGAGALNQFIERREDALMKRTERRPLPSLRIRPAASVVFGAVLSVAGVAILTYANVVAGVLGLATLCVYLFIYTPMKKISPSATLIGGIPGALPPVIGWAAVDGRVEAGALILFAVLFAWQMPHFYSLAWLYRKDYLRAGYKILTTMDDDGRRTARSMTVWSALLTAVMVPAWTTGVFPAFSAIAGSVLGAGMLAASISFQLLTRTDSPERRMNNRARVIFYASLAYLPLLMSAVLADLL